MPWYFLNEKLMTERDCCIIDEVDTFTHLWSIYHGCFQLHKVHSTHFSRVMALLRHLTVTLIPIQMFLKNAHCIQHLVQHIFTYEEGGQEGNISAVGFASFYPSSAKYCVCNCSAFCPNIEVFGNFILEQSLSCGRCLHLSLF